MMYTTDPGLGRLGVPVSRLLQPLQPGGVVLYAVVLLRTPGRSHHVDHLQHSFNETRSQVFMENFKQNLALNKRNFLLGLEFFQDQNCNFYSFCQFQ